MNVLVDGKEFSGFPEFSGGVGVRTLEVIVCGGGVFFFSVFEFEVRLVQCTAFRISRGFPDMGRPLSSRGSGWIDFAISELQGKELWGW